MKEKYKRLLFLLVFFVFSFLFYTCGLPTPTKIIEAPPYVADRQFIKIVLNPSYMSDIDSFQGISFFYKIYPVDSLYYSENTAYSSFQEAYDGDWSRLANSYGGESSLYSLGYLSFNKDLKTESVLPLLRVSQAEQLVTLTITLDFSSLFIGNPNSAQETAYVITEKEGGISVPYLNFSLYRRAKDSTKGEYKTLGYLNYYNLLSQKYDADLSSLPSSFLKNSSKNFYIVIYGLIYAGDIFNPLRSSPFRLTYIGPLFSGTNSL